MICSFFLNKGTLNKEGGEGGSLTRRTVLNYPVHSQREAYVHSVLLRGPDYPGKLYEKILLQNKVHPCTQVDRCTGAAQNKVTHVHRWTDEQVQPRIK